MYESWAEIDDTIELIKRVLRRRLKGQRVWIVIDSGGIRIL